MKNFTLPFPLFSLGAKKLQATDKPVTETISQVAGPGAKQEAGSGGDSQVHGGQVVEEGGGEGGGQGRTVAAHTRVLSGTLSYSKITIGNHEAVLHLSSTHPLEFLYHNSPI